MSDQAQAPSNGTELEIHPLRASDALVSRSTFEADCARWQKMIDGGAVAKDNTPVACIAKAAYGEVYGWSPVVAVNRVYLVDGRPCLAAEAMNGLVRERVPTCTIEKVEHDAKHCIVRGKRHPEDDWHVCEFNEDDARRAKLLNKSNWERYPKAMYWARAISMLTRELFPDVTLGAHTKEELEDRATVRVRQVGPREVPMPGASEPTVEDAEVVGESKAEASQEVPAQVEDCPLCHGVEGHHLDPICPNREIGDADPPDLDSPDSEGPAVDATLLSAAVAGKIPTTKTRRTKAKE